MNLRSATLRLVVIATGALTLIVPTGTPKRTSPLNMLARLWGGSANPARQGAEGAHQVQRHTGVACDLDWLFAAKATITRSRSGAQHSGGRLSGNWEERTFNASGTASGTATPNKISLSIKGGVSAKMLVSYTKTTQNVNISLSGVALQGVRISLARS
jgi:hypothetical protein